MPVLVAMIQGRHKRKLYLLGKPTARAPARKHPTSFTQVARDVKHAEIIHLI
jgi:hypothetical protein